MSNMRFNLFGLFFKLFLKADFFSKIKKARKYLIKKKDGEKLKLGRSHA